MATKAKRVHNDIPWAKVHAAWDAGDSYEKMAKRFHKISNDPKDPYKPMRAIASRGLTIGYTDDNGKLVKFKPREGMRNIGAGAKAPKAAKAPKGVAVKVAKGKPGRKPSLGKTVLITLAEDGKHVRFEADKPKALVPVGTLMPSIVNLAHGLGYDLVAKQVAETAVPAAAVATPEVVAVPPQTAQPTTEIAA